MRRIASNVLVCVALIAGCGPASAQWQWGDGGQPEFRGRDRGRSDWNRGQGYSAWDRDQQPRVAPPLRGGEELRDGGARPEIAPVAPPVVAFHYPYAPNSIVVDTEGRRLYFVLPGNAAFAYQIGVGREGFDWTGTEVISRKQAWPDWHPPAEMRQRDPSLPVKMTGGLRNPLGAMALYLGTTLYRIHGTDAETTVGQASSSGCFRMTNAEVLHLAALVDVGTTVHVVRGLAPSRLSGVARVPARGAEAPIPRAGPPPRTRRDPWTDWDRPPPYWQYRERQNDGWR